MAQPPQSPVWMNVVAAVVFFGGLGAVAFAMYRRRVRALETLAGRWGLSYGPPDDPPDIRLPGGLHLPGAFWSDELQAGEGVTGTVEGQAVTVCIVRRILDPATGKTRGYPVNIAIFDLPGKSLPDCLVRPRKWWARMMSGDPAWEDTPAFARRFKVETKDPDQSGKALTPAVREWLSRHPGTMAQVVEGRLCYCRPSRMLGRVGFRPKAVERLLREGLELAGLLREQSDSH